MLVSRAGLSPVMVGRDAELEQLRCLAAAAITPTIALIGGEPGIGKTRLASELVGAVAAGTTVLLAQADPGRRGQPYRLLRDLAESPAGDEHHDQREAMASALAEGDPMARGQAARDLLRALVAGRRAVLVLDDLHWADPESLAVFEQLDEVAAGSLLLVGTYRPEELSRRHPLAELLERLDRRRGVTHLRLGRLTPSDTARFLTAVYGRAPWRTVAALHHRTGGNPFFLEELLKAAGDTDLDEIHTQPLPWNLAEALRSQLDGLPADQRQVVETVAVLGARVSFDLLATVTGLAEPEMVAALRDLVRRGLLVEAEDDQFGFRHTLTREAVTGEMLGRQRRQLHEAALAALRASPAPDPTAVAVHAHGAGRYAEMVDVARQGATELLAAGSAYGALTLAELALDEAPDDVELLALAATAGWRVGYLTDARRHATHGLRVAADDEQRVATLTQLVRIAWEQGALADMADYTEQVRALTETLPDGAGRAQALATVARSYMLRACLGDGNPTEAVAWAERAGEAAQRHGLPEVRLSALVEKGSTLVSAPDTFTQGRHLLTEVAAESERAGAHLPAARGVAQPVLAAATGRPGRARRTGALPGRRGAGRSDGYGGGRVLPGAGVAGHDRRRPGRRHRRAGAGPPGGPAGDAGPGQRGPGHAAPEPVQRQAWRAAAGRAVPGAGKPGRGPGGAGRGVIGGAGQRDRGRADVPARLPPRRRAHRPAPAGGAGREPRPRVTTVRGGAALPRRRRVGGRVAGVAAAPAGQPGHRVPGLPGPHRSAGPPDAGTDCRSGRRGAGARPGRPGRLPAGRRPGRGEWAHCR